MGDISAEPSMEEILSSIKRIIAEEGDAPGRPRRPSRAMPPPMLHPSLDDAEDEDDDDAGEVLELSDPMPVPPLPTPPAPPPTSPLLSKPAPRAAAPTPAAPPAAQQEPAADPIVSPRVAEASRGSLEALTRLMVKPEAGSDGTLEGLVREMLRPMLREWLDANLPGMVETMVAREIARITGEGH